MRKLPDNITREDLRQFVGTEGTLLNPVQDADGNWVVSEIEWDSHEFDFLKKDYPDLAQSFTKIEWNPPPIIEPPV